MKIHRGNVVVTLLPGKKMLKKHQNEEKNREPEAQ
jgi:hypothetical protein